MSTIATGRCPVLILYICLVSMADVSISIDHSASAFRINNQHIMEAATAADLTQASEIPGRYVTLGSAAKGYVSGLTVRWMRRRSLLGDCLVDKDERANEMEALTAAMIL